MIQLIIELPDMSSIKDKRRVVKSLKERLQRKYKVSIAEVDCQNSLTFSHLGAALVSNSKQHGEMVMHKILKFVEDQVPGRIQDIQIYSERY
ncbi:MAG: DUF503 domain-containing protein [Spirochaetia bacterium]